MTMISSTVLRDMPIFSHLSEKQLAGLAAIAEERALAPGTIIAKEDAVADTMYVILQGRVGIRFSLRPFLDARQLCLDVLHPGELLGWSALVPPRRLTGSAVCMDDVRAVAFNGDALRAVLDSDQALGYTVMSYLSEVIATRLRDARMQLVQELAQTAQT
jgi:CRP-like cAMP-binding protein